jgi:hypothetical protein
MGGRSSNHQLSKARRCDFDTARDTGLFLNYNRYGERNLESLPIDSLVLEVALEWSLHFSRRLRSFHGSVDHSSTATAADHVDQFPRLFIQYEKRAQCERNASPKQVTHMKYLVPNGLSCATFCSRNGFDMTRGL